MKSVLQESYLRVFAFARAFGSVASDVPSPEDLTACLHDLRKVQGSAVIIGGLAVGFHGWERATTAVNLLYASYDTDIFRRLRMQFEVRSHAPNGWHKLVHLKTGVRLELVPSGYRATHGILPEPANVAGRSGFVSLRGLILLKLLSARPRDFADVCCLCRVRMKQINALKKDLPETLRPLLTNVTRQAIFEIRNDPWRIAEEQSQALRRLTPHP